MENVIYIGGTFSDGEIETPLVTFTNADIEELNSFTSISLVSDELAADEFRFSAIYTETQRVAFKYGMDVWYFRGGVLAGKFYIKSVQRRTRDKYSFTCQSAIGLLSAIYHRGGLYSAENPTTVADLIDDIMDYGGTPIVPYTIDNEVSQVFAHGWLPRDTKRENLHQVLFAYAVTMLKNADGSVRFAFLDQPVTDTIPDDRIFYGGSVDESDHATSIELTEYGFIKTSGDSEQVLFDNTSEAPADHAEVFFSDSPFYDLTASDTLTIEEIGVNYAIVSGAGVLKGKEYTTVTRSIKKSESVAIGAENAMSISGITMVTAINSQNVLDRLFAYYSAKNEVNMSIVLDEEKCGDQVTFTNPYGESDAGYITQLDVSPSSFARANAKIISGYTAQGFGNYYKNYVVLTGSGTFTVPEDASDKIRAIIIGGGQGGRMGKSGSSGNSGTVTVIPHPGTNAEIDAYYGGGGHGGDGGLGGLGGRVNVQELSVSAGDTFSYSCGTGGAAATEIDTDGEDGTATTFGTHSSADGAISNGIANVFTGQIFGARGDLGINGADGGGEHSKSVFQGGNVSYLGNDWFGGLGSTDGYQYYEASTNTIRGVSGGSGGGAAVGNNGGDCVTGTTRKQYTGGLGGNAQDAEIANNYGCGGNGGHGGGGGGGGGFVAISTELRPGQYYVTSATPMTGAPGGTGGNGSDGGDGCVIIYY